MKLIYHEIKKVLSKRLFLSVLAFCFIVNLCVFYFFHNEYSDYVYKTYKAEYAELIDEYKDIPTSKALENLTEKQEALNIYYAMKNITENNSEGFLEYEINILKDAQKNSPEAYALAEEMLRSGGINEDIRFLNSIIKMQLEYFEEYPEFVGEMNSRADEQTSFSVFADKESFSYKNIVKTAKDYSDLENTKLSVGNDYSFTSALFYNVTDYFVIAIIFLMCIYLFRFERDKGLYSLVRSSKNGRLKTIAAKLSAMLVMTSFITFFMVFSIFALSITLFGRWDLARSIQSVKVFRNCILPIRCDDFCLLFIIGKMLAMMIIAVFLSFVFIIISGTVLSYTVAGFSLASEFILYNTIPSTALLNHLKYINIFYFLNGAEFFGKYLNLNIFSVPVFSNIVSGIVSAVLFVICTIISIIVFTIKGQESRPNPIMKKLDEFKQKHSKIRGSATVLSGEFYKYFISSKMAAVILVMIIFAVSSSLGSVQYRTTEEAIASYRQYIAEIEGKTPTQAKSFIEEQQQALIDLNSRTEQIMNDEKLSPTTKEFALKSIQSSQSSQEEGFGRLYEQYERLHRLEEQGIDARFIDEIVYSDYIYNDIREWRSVLICLILMIITIPFVFTYEYRKNMIDLLQATKNGRRKLFRAKLTVVMLSAFITFLVSFLTFVIRFKNSFGSKCMNIPIVCISDFENCGLTISVGTAYFIELLIYFCLTIAAAAVIVMLSVYVRNHMLTAIFSAVVLIIPCLVLYSLKNARAGAIYNGNSMTKIIILLTVLIITAAVLIFVSIRKFTKSTAKGS